MLEALEKLMWCALVRAEAFLITETCFEFVVAPWAHECVPSQIHRAFTPPMRMNACQHLGADFLDEAPLALCSKDRAGLLILMSES